MAQTQLNIPVLVQQISFEEELNYHIRPVFTQYPVATHRHYEKAVAQFKKEVARVFKGVTIDRDNMDDILWFAFNPGFNYHRFKLSFTLGKQLIQGTFGVIAFQLQNIQFIQLPAFGNAIHIVPGDLDSRNPIKSYAAEKIENLMGRIRKQQKNEFNPKIYFAHKKEFATTIGQSVTIGASTFQFERQDLSFFFRKFQPNSDFDGEVETEKVGFDLSTLFPSGLLQAFGREEWVTQLEDVLFQSQNTPLVLVGEEGVGRHSLIHEAVRRYLAQYEANPPGVRKQRVWHVDPTRIIAGMSIVGMWEKRFEAILKFVYHPKTPHYSDKLMVDNPVALLRIGKSAQNDLTLGHVLKPYLEKRQIQLILIATPEEWKLLQETDRSFSDLFQVLRIPPARPEEAVNMVLEQRKLIEMEHGVEITIPAIQQLFKIHRNYLKTKALPGSVMKMLRQLATKYRGDLIDSPEVRNEFRDISGLQEQIFDTSSSFEEGDVYQRLDSELVGQSDAVEALSNVIHLMKAKLTPGDAPIASFLFIGPTGVGKTQAAKVLCRYLMGDEKHLIRFDMNEFINESAVIRLVGDPSNPEGLLTGKVRYQPFGVLLFDEIEKAHPAVVDLLLQVLDDGRLTDSRGRTVDFTNTIIIMTSNLGAREAASQLGFGKQANNDPAVYQKAVERYFRPEFINRIGRIVIFRPLALDHILNIARLQIKELLSRDGFVRRTTLLNISKDALEWVARRGFDASMGGRALKRQIERDLTTLSAEQLVSTYSETPIIFDINYEDQQLKPQITPLAYCERIQEEWLPQLPNARAGKSFFVRLIRSVERLEKKINRIEDSALTEDGSFAVIGSEQHARQNWELYDFKNMVSEQKEQLRTAYLSFQSKVRPNAPIRVKVDPSFSEKVNKADYLDQIFQMEAIRELQEHYEFSNFAFDSLRSEFLEHFLGVSFLNLQGQGFLNGPPQEATMYFDSLISGLGKEQIEYLMSLYVTLFEGLDLVYTEDKEAQTLKVRAYSTRALLGGEQGIHLFYIHHGNPLPIRLRIRIEDRSINRAHSYTVIRLYDEASTITDFRSGFTNTYFPTANELKVFLYAGLPNGIRASLMNGL
jgi:ATP-dependent Clp protease ATP-binding subunit ClpC